MSDSAADRSILLGLAAEGVAPVLDGCAGALAAAGSPGVGGAVEKVINFFGGRIVERWARWLESQPPEARQKALAELASLPAADARRAAEELLRDLPLEQASPADRE